MADNIVSDSHLAIFVQQVPVANTVKANDVVRSGAIFGVAGIDARLGENGNYYTSVDTAAKVRLPAGTTVLAVGDKVYWSGTAITTTASGNGVSVGYAFRAKAAAAGDAWIQLIPAIV